MKSKKIPEFSTSENSPFPNPSNPSNPSNQSDSVIPHLPDRVPLAPIILQNSDKVSNNNTRKKMKKKKKKKKKKKLKNNDMMYHHDPSFTADYVRLNLENIVREEKTVARKNLSLIKIKWLEILRRAKNQSMKDSVKSMSNWFVQSFEYYNNYILMLNQQIGGMDRRIEEQNVMHKRNFRELAGIHKERVRKLDKEFEEKCKGIEREFNEELKQINDDHEESVLELKQILHELKNRKIENMSEQNLKMMKNLKAIQNQHTKTIHIIKSDLKQKINELSTKLQTQNKELALPLQKKYRRYLTLKQSNINLTNLLKNQNQQIEKLRMQLQLWKAKWLSSLRNFSFQNKKLNSEIAIVLNNFLEVKEKMTNYQKFTKKRMAKFSNQSRAVEKELNKRITLIEKIISLNKICKKDECELDLQISFEDDLSERIEQFELDHFLAEKKQKQKQKFNPVSTVKMENFFKRMNSVQLSCELMDEENKGLKKENEKLKQKLKRYVDGVTVNSRVMKARNNELLQIRAFSKAAPQAIKFR